MNGLQVVQRQYANHWPIWCLTYESGRVLLCRQTEKEARQELEAMKGPKPQG